MTFPLDATDLTPALDSTEISSTILGPSAGWPAPLKRFLEAISASQFPMFILWGPERLLFYNAAYAPILGPHHPSAMGREFFDVWPEVRDEIEPIIAQAYRGESSLFEDLPVTLRRPDPEQAWFTFSYSPLKDDIGDIAGALCVCTETSTGVRARSRLAFLVELERQFRGLQGGAQILGLAQSALADHLQVDRVEFEVMRAAEKSGATQNALLSETIGAPPGSARLAPGIIEMIEGGEPLAIANVHTDLRMGDGRTAWFLAASVQAAVVSPLIQSGRMVATLFVQHHTARAWTPGEIALIEDVAERSWSAIEKAGAEDELRTRERLLRFLDEMALETAACISADELLSVTTRMTAQHLELSNCAYADMDSDQDGFTIRGNWHAPGSPSIVGHYQLSDFGALAVHELSAGRPLIINDNLSEIAPHEAKTFQDIGISATICMPLMRGGKLVALMAIHDGAPHRWSDYELTVIREVTARSWAHVERVRSEALVRDREERLRVAMHAAAMGTWDWDLVTARGTWSERTSEIMGVPAGEEITPERRYQLMHPDDRDQVARQVAQSIKDGADFSTEYRIVRPDGEVRWIASHGRVLLGDGGRAIRTTGIVRDVTRRRRAQDALEQLNSRLEQEVARKTAERDRMWNYSGDLFVVIGRRWEIRAVNPAAKVLLGIVPEAAVGRRFDTFVHSDDLKDLAGAIRTAASRPIGDFQARLRDEAGNWRQFSWTAAPADGEAYVIGRDITAEVERKRDLELAQEALRQSQRLEALGKLTGGVAHDFNNLLTPIMGGLDLLSRARELTDRQKNWVSSALESSERARTLVHRLLAFARQQPLRVGPTDVSALVGNMAELIRSTSGPHIQVKVATSSALPPAEADPNQLEMAILNLAVNARDAMTEGGTLSITAAHEVLAAPRGKLAAGAYVRISVSDTGTGMDEETLARSIEPFYSTKGVGKGTGLGLSMVDGLASQLGGALLIESHLGLGTSASVYLPVSNSKPPAPKTSPRESTADCSGTILLVDDDDAARGSTKELLLDLGFEVREACSGSEALDLLESFEAIDAVVTDHLMPGMTGSELGILIGNRWPNLPVLLISGYADLDSIAPGMARLAKPFGRDQLLAELERFEI